MVGGEVEAIQEVCSENRLTDVSNDKSKVECAICDANLAVGEAVARNV